MSKADGKCDCAAHSEAECVCGVWAESKCDTCDDRLQAYRYKEKVGQYTRLREELAASLSIQPDLWAFDALDQALASIARMKARAARWKAAAKRMRRLRADEQAFRDACATEDYLNDGPT